MSAADHVSTPHFGGVVWAPADATKKATPHAAAAAADQGSKRIMGLSLRD
jgi:hypothetical protein